MTQFVSTRQAQWSGLARITKNLGNSIFNGENLAMFVWEVEAGSLTETQWSWFNLLRSRQAVQEISSMALACKKSILEMKTVSLVISLVPFHTPRNPRDTAALKSLFWISISFSFQPLHCSSDRCLGSLMQPYGAFPKRQYGVPRVPEEVKLQAKDFLQQYYDSMKLWVQ